MSDRERYDDEYDEVDEYDEEVHYDGVDEYERNPDERGKWVSALVGVAGVWLVVQAFLFEILAANVWNDVVVGLALVALSGYNLYRRADQRGGSTAAAGLVALLGLWLMVSPEFYDQEFGFTEVVAEVGYVNDFVLGVFVLVLGVYSGIQARDTGTVTTPT